MMKNISKIFILSAISILCLTALDAQAAGLSVGFGGTRISREVKSFQDIRKSSVVAQSLDYSCGPAALATLLSYYFEDKVSEEEIIKFLLLTSDLNKVKARGGFSLLDLKNFAKFKGYEVVGYQADLDFLTKINKPVLIPVSIKDYAHFVVFRGMEGNRVFLADPALGKITITKDKFLHMWQAGIGLVLTRQGEEKSDSPLSLSKKERAVAADPAQLRQSLGIHSLGQIYSQSEF